MRTGSGDQSELTHIAVSATVLDFNGTSKMVFNYRMYDISDILKKIPKLKSPYYVASIDLIVPLSTNVNTI